MGHGEGGWTGGWIIQSIEQWIKNHRFYVVKSNKNYEEATIENLRSLMGHTVFVLICCKVSAIFYAFYGVLGGGGGMRLGVFGWGRARGRVL